MLFRWRATVRVRQSSPRVVPIIGARTVEQIEDNLGCLEVELTADQTARLDEVSRIDLGFPYSLLGGPDGKMVYGDREPAIDLPPTVPLRWAS